jgi:hypothetical protein
MSLCDSCSFAVEMDGDYTARLAKVGVLRLRLGPDGPAWWRVRADSAGVMQRSQELEMHSAHSRGSPVDREWRLCISADFGAGENVYVGNRSGLVPLRFSICGMVPDRRPTICKLPSLFEREKCE